MAHAGVAAGLRLQGVAVTTTPKAGLLHASDEGQLADLVPHGRVILTLSRTSFALQRRARKAQSSRGYFSWVRLSKASTSPQKLREGSRSASGNLSMASLPRRPARSSSSCQ